MNKHSRFSVLATACVALVLASVQCSREAATDQHAEDHDADHGHEHDPTSLGKVTMMPDAFEANGVEIARSGPGLVSVEIDLPGEVVLNADRVAHIVPRFPGVVLQVNKALGDPVRSGEVLAVVQSNVSAAAYDVVSMVDGTVIEKHVALGEFVRDDADIFVVADLSTVWVNISVYARFLTDVKRGQKVRITSPGVRATARGTIDYVGPIVGESTRTGVARMVLPNPERLWQPGLFVTAHITVSEERVPVAVPDGAIQTVEGREVVFVRRMNEFTARPIVTGRRGADLIEVVEGLAPGEDYVAAGSFIFKAEFGKSEAGHEH
ncbi:MAG TPA: efflux RND transporter periplasmic adaptor subunit [Candidatus Krumholzibacteria bacterium]|nr:efflux RND transporter periplasmic adaptor subunit [Candidatus Krumholzibacteria bacterium]